MAGPTVITGLGVVSSIGSDVESFTEALRAGECGVTAAGGPVAGTEPTLLATLRDFELGAALERITGLPPATRRSALRAARRSPVPVQAALAAAAQAWQQAGLGGRGCAGDRIGLVVGGHNLTAAYAFEHYPTYLREPGHLPARYALQVQDTDHIGTISQALGITGEGYTVGASSASGNVALQHAARLVELGAVDVCLAVGAMARLDPAQRVALAKLGVLAGVGEGPPDPDGPQPFDQERAGFVPGEATACLTVESAASARARRVPPLAELAGCAQALDGHSLAAPSVEGEVRAMQGALARAGLDPAGIDYVNAHATATPAGDDAELRALREVLGATRCWVNSTKALVGHCLTAAGAIEAVATVVQIREEFVHPNPGLVHPVDAKYRLAGPVAVPARIEAALSNSFGFGGVNSCLVLRRA